MIRHDCKQGSERWNELRLGRPTASLFERIITPAKGQLSKQSDGLLHRLVGERLTGYGDETICTAAMKAGHEREPEAAAWYAFAKDVEIQEVGICFTDDGRVGASPDRMVSGGGLLELKCPLAGTHCGYLLGGGIIADYKPQIQGQLWVCEAEWLDSVSYYQRLPKSLVRIYRDEEYIAAMAAALEEFCDRLDEAEAKILAMGDMPVPPSKQQRENQEVWDAWRPTL